MTPALARAARCLTGSALLAGSSVLAADPAELVIHGGTIYTADSDRPQVEVVAVNDGGIVAVGGKGVLEQRRGPSTRVIDLDGRTMVPGFVDAHVHLAGIGRRELTLNLDGTDSLEAFKQAVAERVAEVDEGQWITGRGWIETHWQPPEFPTREDLDEVAPNHPVYLTRADGHAGIANSKALDIAGVDEGTEAPFGGEILRDEQGHPTGMLIDDAQELVTEHIPDDNIPHERALDIGAERSVKLGLTQVHIAGTSWDQVEALESLYDRGAMKLRVYHAVSAPGDAAERLLARGPIIDAFDGRLTVRALKVYADGALGSKGAALLEPYNDHKGRGLLRFKPEEVRPLLKRALRKGLQVWTHAIGDRANRLTLDLYAEAFDTVLAKDRDVIEPRWRIEHAQIIHPDDVPRFDELGVIPSMQPSHAIGDLHFARSRLGLERMKRGYPWQSLLDAGAVIAGGSDAPVEKGDPIVEFYAATVRKDLEGYSGEGWHREEAVSREYALKMLTLWPAYAAFQEDQRGSIEPGKQADFTVLSQDIMRIPDDEIPATKAVMTIIGGEVVYSAGE